MRNSMTRVFLNPQGFIRDAFPGEDYKALRVSIREHALYVRGGYGAFREDGTLARNTVPGYVLGIMTAAYTVGDTAARFTYL